MFSLFGGEATSPAGTPAALFPSTGKEDSTKKRKGQEDHSNAIKERPSPFKKKAVTAENCPAVDSLVNRPTVVL